MVRKLVAFALYQPLFLAARSHVLFVGAGIVAFRSLPVEAFPDVSDVQATVITLVPGHAPEEVEKQVTIPLEIVLAGVPHAVRMFSHTQFGLSFLTLTFDDEVDDYFARQRVLERLQQADLPPDIQPQLAPLSTPVGELYRFRLVSDHASPTELRSIEDWVVERQLKMAPGVADVVSRGGFIKQYQVNLDLARMKAYGVVAAAGLHRARSRQRERRRELPRTGRAAVSDSRRGSAPIARGHRHHRRGGTRRHAAADSGHRGRQVGAVPRQGLVGRNDEDEIVDGHRPDAQGREPLGGADRGQGARRAPERVDSAEGRADRVVLRPLDAHPTTLTTVFQQPAGGRAAGDAGAVRVSAQRARGRHRRGRDSAGAPRHLHRPARPRHPGQPAVARRHGFRHHRRRRRHRRRERFPDARECRAASRDRESVRQAILDATAQVGRPTLFSMLIIIVAHIPIFTLQRHEGRIFAPMAYTVTSALVGLAAFFADARCRCCACFCSVAAWRTSATGSSKFCTRLYRARPDTRAASAAARRRERDRRVRCRAARSCRRSGTEFLPELNEGHALGEPHAAAERVGGGGVAARRAGADGHARVSGGDPGDLASRPS